MQWSGLSVPRENRISFEATMSSMTLAFRTFLLPNSLLLDKLRPSLLPGRLYEAIHSGLIPAPTKSSTKAAYIWVWSDMQSSPPTITLCLSAKSVMPGARLSCGVLLM